MARDSTESRRAALLRLTSCLLAAATGWIPVARGREAEELVCARPDSLTEMQKQQRKLDNYTEKSPDPGKTCSACRFFTAATGAAACGQCAIFNGPANPQGKCDDWTARAA